MAKIGRNDPCPCGSGKKYKKCCLDKDLASARAAQPVTESNSFEIITEPYNEQRPSEILSLIEETGSLARRGKELEACEVGWAAWQLIRKKITPNIRTTRELENELYLGFGTFSNWCSDFEMYLGNAGIDDSRFHEKRIEYCREFRRAFPAESQLTQENMGRAVGESLYSLGRVEEADHSFEELSKEFPTAPWVRLGWGALYQFGRNKSLADLEKAEQIYQKALEETEGEEMILRRRLKEIAAMKKKASS